MGNPAKLISEVESSAAPAEPNDPIGAGAVLPFEIGSASSEPRTSARNSRRLVSTKELSEILGTPESTLRYWRCAEIGPPYVKLGGRIKYDLADVELYVRANKRMPSVRAHGG
jgi:hypothetical protein